MKGDAEARRVDNVMLASWRLEQNFHFLVASNDDRDNQKLFATVNQLIGTKLKSCSVIEPALDTHFEFSDGLKLSVFNLRSQGWDIDHEAWRFYYSTKILSVGPGAKLETSNRNG
jgi:hypothetical protein